MGLDSVYPIIAVVVMTLLAGCLLVLTLLYLCHASFLIDGHRRLRRAYIFAFCWLALCTHTGSLALTLWMREYYRIPEWFLIGPINGAVYGLVFGVFTVELLFDGQRRLVERKVFSKFSSDPALRMLEKHAFEDYRLHQDSAGDAIVFPYRASYTYYIEPLPDGTPVDYVTAAQDRVASARGHCHALVLEARGRSPMRRTTRRACAGSTRLILISI